MPLIKKLLGDETELKVGDVFGYRKRTLDIVHVGGDLVLGVSTLRRWATLPFKSDDETGLLGKFEAAVDRYCDGPLPAWEGRDDFWRDRPMKERGLQKGDYVHHRGHQGRVAHVEPKCGTIYGAMVLPPWALSMEDHASGARIKHVNFDEPNAKKFVERFQSIVNCLLYTSPSPRD